MRILGIDPGLRALGWGVVETSGSRIVHVANGLCKSQGEDLASRLLSLHRQLSEVIEDRAPDAAAAELTFVNRDGSGSLKLGQARGVAILAAAQAGIAVGEYAPNAIKKMVVGVGHADKRQVAHMVRMMLPGAQIAGQDAADALAVALAHAHVLSSSGRLQRALEQIS